MKKWRSVRFLRTHNLTDGIDMIVTKKKTNYAALKVTKILVSGWKFKNEPVEVTMTSVSTLQRTIFLAPYSSFFMIAWFNSMIVDGHDALLITDDLPQNRYYQWRY